MTKFDLKEAGGSWLGACRSWIQWHFRNGSDVTWGSGDILRGELRVRELEDLALDVAHAAICQYRSMPGRWRKRIPTKAGTYWTADRQGRLAGLKVVAYADTGELIFAGHAVRQPGDGFAGWWWSEPVAEPPLPPPWEGDA